MAVTLSTCPPFKPSRWIRPSIEHRQRQEVMSDPFATLIDMAKQLELGLPIRGGRRRGAGRPRLHEKPGLIGKEVPHRAREAFGARTAVHVTQRVRPGVPSLRKQPPRPCCSPH